MYEGMERIGTVTFTTGSVGCIISATISDSFHTDLVFRPSPALVDWFTVSWPSVSCVNVLNLLNSVWLWHLDRVCDSASLAEELLSDSRMFRTWLQTLKSSERNFTFESDVNAELQPATIEPMPVRATEWEYFDVLSSGHFLSLLSYNRKARECHLDNATFAEISLGKCHRHYSWNQGLHFQ